MQFLGAFSTAGQVAPSSILCERKQTSLKDDIFKTWRVDEQKYGSEEKQPL